MKNIFHQWLGPNFIFMIIKLEYITLISLILLKSFNVIEIIYHYLLILQIMTKYLRYVVNAFT